MIEVMVGNIGCVYRGSDGPEAWKVFREYVEMSKGGYGRASGESVTLMEGETVRAEHRGSEEL